MVKKITDMYEGARHGTLLLTGNKKLDKHQNVLYECNCDCGEVLHLDRSEVISRQCCNKFKHKLVKKPPHSHEVNLYRSYVGQVLHNFKITDAYHTCGGHRFGVVCIHCGKEGVRVASKFLSKGIPCCNMSKEEKERIRQEKKHIITEERAKIAEKNKQDRIKKFKGMSQFKDLTGQRFGKLVVTKYMGYSADPRGIKHAMFKCKCDCGGTIVTKGTNLTSGSRKYCDKELNEIKSQSGSLGNKVKVEMKLANGETLYENVTFRQIHKDKLCKFSQSVYEKYSGVCQCCHKYHRKKYCEAHHIVPIAQNKELAFTISNGILLCRNCHQKFHLRYGGIGFNPKDIFTYIEQYKSLYGRVGSAIQSDTLPPEWGFSDCGGTWVQLDLFSA